MEDKFQWQHKIKVKKPTFIPFRVNPAPSKTFNIRREFGNVLSEKFSTDSNPTQNMSKQEQRSYTKNLALSKALVDTIKMSQQYLHLHSGHLAKIDQSGLASNFERLKDSSYKNFNNLLHQGIAGANFQDTNKKKKNIKNDHEHIDLNIDGQNPHDINPYFGFSNVLPFKKGSKLLKDFKQSPLLQLFSSNFHSTLRELGQEMWDTHSQTISNIQEKAVNFKNLPDPFADNNSTLFDIHSGYKSVINNPLVWEEFSQKESFHFLLNRHERRKQYSSVLRSIVGKHVYQLNNIKLYEEKLNNPENKTHLNSTEILDEVLNISFGLIADFESLSEEELAENLLNVESVLNDNYTKIDETLGFIEKHKDLFTEEELIEIKELKENNNKLAQELDKYNVELTKTLEESRLIKPNLWIEKIGNNLDQLPFYFMYNIFLEAAPLVAKEIDLGLSNEENDSTRFQNKMITDYLNQFKETSLGNISKINPVTAEDLMIDNIQYGQKVRNGLIALDIIDEKGKIKTENFNLDTLTLNANFEEYEEIRIRQQLKKKLLGEYSFDLIDKTRVNGRFRENIQLTTPYGEKVHFNKLFTPIFEAETEIKKYEESKKTYSVLMDIYESMTNLSCGTEGANAPIIKENDNMFELEIYPKSSWIEQTNETEIDLLTGFEKNVWEAVTDQPLVLKSNNKEDLIDFFNKIEKSLLQLEPLIATFTPLNNSLINKESLSYQDGEIISLPMRVLIDNVGDIVNDEIVVAGSVNHKFSIDTLFTQTYFETNDFKTKSVSTRNMLNNQVGKNIFGKGVINSISRLVHNRDKEAYKKDKEKAKDEVFEEKKAEMRRYSRKVAKRKSDAKKAENKKIASQKELLAYIERMNKIKENQRKIAKKAQAKRRKAKRKA